MKSITATCDRVAWLADGRIAEVGNAETVVANYLKARVSTPSVETRRKGGSGEIRIVGAVAERATFAPADVKSVRIELDFVDPERVTHFYLAVEVRTEEGKLISHVDSTWLGPHFAVSDDPRFIDFELSSPWLLPGRYRVDVYVAEHGVMDAIDGACTFDVFEDLPYEYPPSSEVAFRNDVLPTFVFKVPRS